MQELSLHVLDLMQNAVEAGASRVEVEVREDPAGDRLTIRVADNGRGMAPEQAARVTDAFYTTRRERRVGLGVPLLEEAAAATGGEVKVTSVPGAGTQVEAGFGLSHLDRAPLGDMGATLATALVGRPGLRLCYRHVTDSGEFVFDSDRLREQLGEVAPDHPLVVGWLQQQVRAGLAQIGSKA